jgi:hypothetical protein
MSASLMSALEFRFLSLKVDSLTPLVLKTGAFWDQCQATLSAEATKSSKLDLSDRWSFDGPVKEFNFEVFAGGTGASICKKLAKAMKKANFQSTGLIRAFFPVCQC